MGFYVEGMFVFLLTEKGARVCRKSSAIWHDTGYVRNARMVVFCKETVYSSEFDGIQG